MNRILKLPNKSRSALAALLAPALLLSPLGFAQENEDEIFELSPFEVSAEGDVGYAAQNTLAGSRLNSRLKDTAASMSVFTTEFLNDIGATDVEEAMLYSVNSEVDFSDAQSNASGGNSILENAFQFRIRGVKASHARNFFSWNLKSDSYNVERIDESRGPNSILFGIGQPGGIMNTSTKKARLGRNSGEVSLSIGENGLRRGSLDVNRILIDDVLAFRFNALDTEKDSFRLFESSAQTNYHFAVTYKPLEKTTLQVEYETADVADSRARPFTSYDRSSLWTDMGGIIQDTSAGSPSKDTANGITTQNAKNPRVTAIADGGEVENFKGFLTTTTDAARLDGVYANGSGFYANDMNLTGPNARRNMDFKTYTAILQHAASEALNFELAFNHVEDEIINWDPTNNALKIYADPNSHLPSGAVNPYAGMYYTDVNWINRGKANDTDQFRASVSYELKTESMGTHRFAALYEDRNTIFERIEKREVLLGAPYNSNPEHGKNRVYRRKYFTPGDFNEMYSADYIEPFTWVDGSDTYTSGFVAGSTSGMAYDRKDHSSHMFSMQNFWLSNRLITTFGYREDDYLSRDSTGSRNADTKEWEVNTDVITEFEAVANTTTLGMVGHITDRFSAFVNHSSGISLGDPNMRTLPYGIVPEPTDDTSSDIGLMLELLEGKLNARLTYFETESLGGADYLGVGGFRNKANDIWEAYQLAGLITDAELDANQTNLGAGYFDRASDGLELQLIANPTKNWRLVFNASETNIIEDDIFSLIAPWLYGQEDDWAALGYVDGDGADILKDSDLVQDAIGVLISDLEERTVFNGKPAFGNRKDKMSFFTKYTFSEGSLKGFSVGGGYRYQGPNPIRRYVDSDDVSHGPSYGLADLVFGYSRKINQDRVKMNLQLNVSNLLDDETRLLLRLSDTGVVLRNSGQAPRSVKLTARFGF